MRTPWPTTFSPPSPRLVPLRPFGGGGGYPLRAPAPVCSAQGVGRFGLGAQLRRECSCAELLCFSARPSPTLCRDTGAVLSSTAYVGPGPRVRQSIHGPLHRGFPRASAVPHSRRWLLHGATHADLLVGSYCARYSPPSVRGVPLRPTVGGRRGTSPGTVTGAHLGGGLPGESVQAGWGSDEE